MFLVVIFFVFFIYNYYSSNKNMGLKSYNRSNIDEILKEKIKDLPILANDTNNVIAFNDTFEERVITKNEKKISKNIDLESSLTLAFRNVEIELKTSLTKNLDNNFIIYTDKDIITLRNIFNISSKSALEFKNNRNKNLYNLEKFNSYHYEIIEISNFLINREIFKNDNLDVSLKKIENKIQLLSDWFEY